MTAPLIAKVSAALRKAAIAEWPDTADIVVIEGYPDDLAQVAVDACGVGELVEALRTLVAAKDEKQQHGETEQYRKMKGRGWSQARAVLAKLFGKPMESVMVNGNELGGE